MRVDLLQGIGPVRQVAQEESGALGEVASPAVDLGGKVAGETTDQLRGRTARGVRGQVLGMSPVLEDGAQSAVQSRGKLAAIRLPGAVELIQGVGDLGDGLVQLLAR